MTIQDANNKENNYNNLISTGGKSTKCFKVKPEFNIIKTLVKSRGVAVMSFLFMKLRFSAIKVIDHLRSPSF